MDSDEAKELHKFLRQYKDTLIAHEDMNIIHLHGIKISIFNILFWNCISKLFL